MRRSEGIGKAGAAAPPSFEGGDPAVGESFGGKRVPLSGKLPKRIAPNQLDIALDNLLTRMLLLRNQTNTGGQGWLDVPRREDLNA